MSHPLNRVPLALQSRSSATVTEDYCEGRVRGNVRSTEATPRLCSFILM